jgi:hypothetical protein
MKEKGCDMYELLNRLPQSRSRSTSLCHEFYKEKSEHLGKDELKKDVDHDGLEEEYDDRRE